jgi:hypothetical protein
MHTHIPGTVIISADILLKSPFNESTALKSKRSLASSSALFSCARFEKRIESPLRSDCIHKPIANETKAPQRTQARATQAHLKVQR